MRDPLRLDDVDRKILNAFVENGRRTFDDVGALVSLSAPAVKRRVDRLRRDGVLRGFTALVDQQALGAHTEALVELFYAPGVQLDDVRASLVGRPEVVEAWSVTGDPDCLIRVRTRDPQDLERLLRDLQRDGSVVRTRSQVVLSRLLERRD
ncbi:MAG TPA: Lrp/AsnC family transcriptional regulator [Baekduia sp.]|nr:Lrp/AsnC family transcriptional regulator [Baekduia sp.]